MEIRIIKTKNGKNKVLDDIKFKSFNEAIEYVEQEIISKDSNKYITYRYNLSKPRQTTVKEFVFIDDNEYFMYSYKIAQII